MKVKSSIEIGEINGMRQPPLGRPTLDVASHWNDRDLVVVITPDGTTFTVIARQLTDAIANAQRWSRS